MLEILTKLKEHLIFKGLLVLYKTNYYHKLELKKSELDLIYVMVVLNHLKNES